MSTFLLLLYYYLYKTTIIFSSLRRFEILRTVIFISINIEAAVVIIIVLSCSIFLTITNIHKL